MIISRESIVKVPTLKKVEVDVTEWSVNGEPATIFVREMTAREKTNFDKSSIEIHRNQIRENWTDLSVKLAIIVCVDENGKQMFTNNDIEWLSQLPNKPLARIQKASKALNEISEEEEEYLPKNATSDSGTTSQ